MAWTEKEITEMLTEIFPPKPEPVQRKLTSEMEEVINMAKGLGLTDIPPIIIVENDYPKPSQITFHDYTETAIEIMRYYVKDRPRSDAKMARSLAHELGHMDHIRKGKGTYETFGFKNAEDWADSFRDQVMSEVSFAC